MSVDGEQRRAGVLFAYRASLVSGELRHDERQLLAVEKLQSLHNALSGYQRQSAQQGWSARFGFGSRRKVAVPMGLYLYGGAGRGKSLLMDMFFASAPIELKRRVHFHEFMLEVHALCKRLRQDGSDNVLEDAARVLAEAAVLLCFDEFHISNIGDAMILARLFEYLLAEGVVVVATSNSAPNELYKDGLQRQSFLPFIALVKERFDILHLDGPHDYRLRNLRSLPLFFDAGSADGRLEFSRAFTLLSGRDKGESCILSVGGREFCVPDYVGEICRFDFVDLCGVPLAAQDYLALAERFRVIFVGGVPIFTNELRNEMKRFILLVDVLYEKRAMLCMSSYGSVADLGQGHDHAFEYQRTYSRLQEMRLAEYNSELAHIWQDL